MRAFIIVSKKPHLHKTGGQWMCIVIIRTWFRERIVTLWGKTPQEAYLRYRDLTDGN